MRKTSIALVVLVILVALTEPHSRAAARKASPGPR